MKRLFVALLVAVMVFALPLTTLAAEDILEVTGGQASPGGTVYFTVSLKEPVEGDSMGISCTYDDKVLAPQPEASFWEQKGVLQDFNANGDGVWTVEKTTELKEQICVLAFRVLENAEAKKTEITCALTVKDGSKVVGTYEAAAQVTLDCDHSFGYWHGDSALGHYRVCIHCDQRQTSSHIWDKGTAGVGKNEGKTCYTCEVCKATRIVDPISGQQEVVPSETEPVDDGHGHAHDYEPTQPYRDYNDPEEQKHDHAGETIGFDEHGHPIYAPDGGDDGHDHGGHGLSSGEMIAAVCIILGVVAAVTVACVLVVRKKK